MYRIVYIKILEAFKGKSSQGFSNDKTASG